MIDSALPKPRPMCSGPGFRITGDKGFHITFANGWTVSVQFGPGNYCDNYDEPIGHAERECGKRGSTTAEVAAWPEGGQMLRLDSGDTVAGRVSADYVAKLIADISTRPRAEAAERQRAGARRGRRHSRARKSR